MTEQFQFEVPASCAHLGPGFDVLGIALDLSLTVKVEPRDDRTHVVVRLSGFTDFHEDRRHDPILRALHAATETFGIKVPPGLTVSVESSIPSAAGLGTTSAAYAAGLAVAARFWDGDIPLDDLTRQLVELGGGPGHGAAALNGGLVSVTELRDGEGAIRYHTIAHQISDDWLFVLACPVFQVSTADTKRLLPANVPHGAIGRTAGKVLGLLQALANGDEDLLGRCIVDEAHVPYRRLLAPGIDQAMRAGREAGAAGVTISGAGPSLVALTTDADKCDRIGQAMAEAFETAGLETARLSLKMRPVGALPRSDEDEDRADESAASA